MDAKIQNQRRKLSDRDAFRPCSRVSSSGRTGGVTNRKASTEEKTNSISSKEVNPIEKNVGNEKSFNL